MTGAARGFRAGVSRVAILDHAPLGLESSRSKLRRREALLIAQVANDRARGCGIERKVVQRHHSAHRHLPPFGRLSLVRDALHVARAIAEVTFAARGDCRAIANHEAGRGIALWARRTSAPSSALASTAAASSTLCE